MHPTSLNSTYVFFFAFCRNSLRGTDPFLVLTTCVYLACKIEECPHHIKLVVQEVKHILQGKCVLNFRECVPVFAVSHRFFIPVFDSFLTR